MSRPTHEGNWSGWSDFVSRYGVGDVLPGRVVSVLPFGAFVRVGDGVDGLAPQDLWPALPADGSTVRVRIAAIDDRHRRVALGPA